MLVKLPVVAQGIMGVILTSGLRDFNTADSFYRSK